MESEYHNAFGQLRRSIEDGEERFYLRMQEWEQQQTAPRLGDSTPIQNGSDPRSGSSRQNQDELRFDDDDVEIIVHSDISFYSHQSKPGEDLSHNMDADAGSSPFSLHHRSSFDSFMEEDGVEEGSASPSLRSSSIFSNGLTSSASRDGLSTSSSMVSMPLLACDTYSQNTYSQPQSKSDRAIAALTLALANGAAGLHDYHDILQVQGSTSGCDAGGLWD